MAAALQLQGGSMLPEEKQHLLADVKLDVDGGGKVAGEVHAVIRKEIHGGCQTDVRDSLVKDRYRMTFLGFFFGSCKVFMFLLGVLFLWFFYFIAIPIGLVVFIVGGIIYLFCCWNIGEDSQTGNTSCTSCAKLGRSVFTWLARTFLYPSIRVMLRPFEKSDCPDIHTKLLWGPLSGAILEFKPYTAGQIPISAADPCAVPVVKVANDNFFVSLSDEDVPVRDDGPVLMLHQMCPHVDSRTFWENPEIGEEKIRANFLNGKFKPMQNAYWGTTEEIKSDSCMTKMAFQGLGAPYVTHKSAFTDPLKEIAKDGETYVIDMDFLSKYEVRDDYERYGGIAFYAEDRTITRILYRDRDGELREYLPGDKAWVHICFAFRSVMFAWMTLASHLLYTHFTVANSVQLSQRRNLALHSPLKKFIKPFTFRTAAINKQAVSSLFAESCTLQRTLPQTWDSFKQMLDDGTTLMGWETFPDTLRRRGFDPDNMDQEDNSFYPYAQDGMDLWNIQHEFVTAFINKFHPDNDATENADTQEFWRDMQEDIMTTFITDDLKRGKEGQEQLIDFITTFFFTVTGFHEHVGNVGEYVLNPCMVSSRFRFMDTISTVQASYQLALVTALTGMRQPPLMGDLSAHFVTANDEYKEFREKMGDLSYKIAIRNRTRNQRFFSFDPDKLEVSVSI